MALGRSSSPKSCNGSVKSFRSSGKSQSSGHSQHSTNNKQRYTGLFTSEDAPTGRAYCILFSFFSGVLLMTIGFVFLRVKLTHPMSGFHHIHAPSWTLALGLISAGLLTVLGSCCTACRYGYDDGDDSLAEEDHFSFARDDILNRQYSSPTKSFYDNGAFSTPHSQAHHKQVPQSTDQNYNENQTQCKEQPEKNYYDNRVYPISHPQAYSDQIPNPQGNAQSYPDIRSQCLEEPESLNQSYESLCAAHPHKQQPQHYFSNISIYPSNGDCNSPRFKNFINSQMQEPPILRTTGSCIQLNEQSSLSPNSSCFHFTDQRSITPNSGVLQFHDQPTISPNSSCLQFNDQPSISPNSSYLQFNDQASISPNSSCHQLYVQGPIYSKGVRFQDQVSLSPNSSCHQLYDQHSLSPNSSILKFPVQESLSPNNSCLKIQSSPVTYSNLFMHNKDHGSPGKAITQIYIGTPDNSQLSNV